MNRALPFLLLTIGCDETLTSDAPQMPYCEDVESSITADEETDIGLTGNDLTDAVPESADGVVEWSGGSIGELNWGFSADSETLRYIESTQVYPEPDNSNAPMIDIAMVCQSSIAIDGTLTLQSNDGQLNEAIPVTLSLYDNNLAINFFADIDALDGSLDLSDYVEESSYDSVALYLTGTITSGILTGELAALGEGYSEDYLFVETIPIATFSDEE
jgi:hypothetical protein